MLDLRHKKKWMFASLSLLTVIFGYALLSRQPIGSITALDAKGHVVCTSFSPDGRWLAAGMILQPNRLDGHWAGAVRVWRVGSWDQVCEFRGVLPAMRLAFSPDGAWLAVAYTSTQVYKGEPDDNAWVAIYDCHSLELRKKLEFPEGMWAKSVVYDVAFSADGNFLGIYNNRETKLWSVPCFERVEFRETGIHLVDDPLSARGNAQAVSSNGVVVAECTLQRPPPECHVVVRDKRSGKEYLTSVRDAGHYCSVCFSADGQLIAVGTGRKITVLANPFE